MKFAARFLCLIPLLATLALATGGDFSSRADKLKFRDAAGKTLFSIKLKEDGAKLVDADEKELARLKFETRDEGRELKIKDADGKTLGAVDGKPPRWRLKDARKQVTFTIAKTDAGYRIDDGDERPAFRVVVKETGVEVDDAAGVCLLKAAAEGHKTVARDAAGKVALSISEPVNALALALLAEEKFSRPQAAALFLLFNEPAPASKPSP